MEANPDFKELLQCLNDARVRYLLVGAHAVAYHSEPRYTKDIDLWVEPTSENAERVWLAWARFGAPLDKVTKTDFANPELVYQIGIEPNRIDILMGVSGLSFPTAWRRRVRTTYGDAKVYVLSRHDLIRTKRAAARPQDFLDLKLLSRPASRRRQQGKRKPKKP